MKPSLAELKRLPSQPPESDTRDASPTYNLRVQRDSLSFTGTELTFLATLDGAPQQQVLVHYMFDDEADSRLDIGTTEAGMVDALIRLLPTAFREEVITGVLDPNNAWFTLTGV